ncbi:MAG: hypothetical protein HY286_17065 [Planctomycetes bacterium]|nr:hypothetical protein [Planctomycetota bacterium]
MGTTASARIAPTFESLHIKTEELPKGWKLDKKLATVSVQPATLIEGDTYKDLIPKTNRQDFQSIIGKDNKGSILYFDWGSEIPFAVLAFVPSLLFGDPIKSTREHPEKIVRSGGVMIIISFPLGSEERLWALERLSRRFGLRIPRDLDELRPAVATIARHELNKESEAGLKFASEHEKELASYSFAAYFEGELAARAKNSARAEKAYARAIALDETSDPLPTIEVLWASRDGLGTALYMQKKYNDGARELMTAAKLAAEIKMPKEQANCLYNCACCFALASKPADAIAALKQSIELDAERKAAAAKDEDFESIKSLAEFLELIK